jgi:hypothetical protein
MKLEPLDIDLTAVSMVKGVTADYRVENGETIVTLRSDHHIKHSAVESGVGMLDFLDQGGKGGGKKGLYFSIDRPQQANFEESVGDDGSQTLTVKLDRLWPAGGLMRRGSFGTEYATWAGGGGGRQGEFRAPAVRIAAPLGGDIWVALLRAPWSPLRLEMGKTELALSHGDGRVSLTLSPSGDAGFSGEVSVSGTTFKNALVTLKRTLGPVTLEERSFDLLFVGGHPGLLNPLEAISAAKELTNALGTSFFPQSDFVLCDGPMVQYAVTLKGDRGMLKHDEDSANLALTWQ